MILDDFSRFIIAWKLCTTMSSQDVTETLEQALKASGCDSRWIGGANSPGHAGSRHPRE